MPPSTARPEATTLDNPLYYLENARTAVDWVIHLYTDLLTTQELSRLNDFSRLSKSAQALLLRMEMRTHDIFLRSSLDYREFDTSLRLLLEELAHHNWVDPDPEIGLPDVTRLFRKDQLFAAFRPVLKISGITKATTPKQNLIAALTAAFGLQRQSLSCWWPECDDTVVCFRETALFKRLKLLFFGNLRQQWSEFVVTVLGHQRYEKVTLSPQSRAFNTREEVNFYLAISDCGDALEAECEDLPSLRQAIPSAPSGNAWLRSRHQRLLFRFGHRAERQGLTSLALEAYRESWNQDARIRYFRVQEKHSDTATVLEELQRHIATVNSQAERENLTRIQTRLTRRLGYKTPARKVKKAPKTQHISLPPARERPIEEQVAQHFTHGDSRCFYVENSLFNSLLALLIWPALFAPVPGAFFHPFQAGPADLFREEFVEKRRQTLSRCLATLDSNHYRERILHTWQAKYGLACPLVSWSLMTKSLITLSLDVIPATHLKAVFQRQLSDLSTHRRGLPDLVRFWPGECRYELIEVKAPGDRLQDHQRHWLDYFDSVGIPAGLCQVTWS
jgi:VRR-NUC domain/FAN1, HTH domain